MANPPISSFQLVTDHACTITQLLADRSHGMQDISSEASMCSCASHLRSLPTTALTQRSTLSNRCLRCTCQVHSVTKGSTRAAWIRRGLESHDDRIRRLAVDCLDAALESYHFTSHYSFDFGAWPRDYGLTPRGADAKAWFAPFIELAVQFGLTASPLGMRVRDLLASRFRLCGRVQFSMTYSRTRSRCFCHWAGKRAG